MIDSAVKLQLGFGIYDMETVYPNTYTVSHIPDPLSSGRTDFLLMIIYCKQVQSELLEIKNSPTELKISQKIILIKTIPWEFFFCERKVNL